MTRFEKPVLPRLVSVALRLGWIGAGATLLLILMVLSGRSEFVAANAMEVGMRTLSLILIALGAVVLPVLAGGYLLVRPIEKTLSWIERWTNLMAPAAWLWPLPLYFDSKVFGGVGLLRVVLAAIWAVGLERAFRACFLQLSERERPFLKALRGRSASWIGAAVVLLLCGWFAWFCAHYSILQHRAFGTSGFDLGLFDNLMFNLKSGEWFRATVDRGNIGGTHLQYHTNFLAWLFVPFYAIKPGSESLLMIQAVVVGLAGIPFYLLAKHKLDSVVGGVLFCFLFLSHEAIQSPVFFDFHFLTLSPLFVGWTLYFFETERRWQLIVCWCLALLLREDQGTVLAGAALVYLLAGKRPVWALVAGSLGVFWLGLMRFYVMPMNSANQAFQQHIGIFEAMVAPGTHGFGGVLKTIATNLPFTLNNFLEARKLEYVLALSVPFLMLPFRQPRTLLLFIPAVLFTLVSTNYAPSVSTRFQYTMYWVPMLILGSLFTFDDWRKRPNGTSRIRAAMAAIFVIATALSFDGGGLLGGNGLYGGFRKVNLQLSQAEATRWARLQEFIVKIPASASVTASEQVVPHVSTRRDIYTLRQGVGNPDYVLFMNDEVRDWRSPGGQGAILADALRTGNWGFVASVPGFQLWKRGGPKSGNARAAAELGIPIAL